MTPIGSCAIASFLPSSESSSCKNFNVIILTPTTICLSIYLYEKTDNSRVSTQTRLGGWDLSIWPRGTFDNISPFRSVFLVYRRRDSVLFVLSADRSGGPDAGDFWFYRHNFRWMIKCSNYQIRFVGIYKYAGCQSVIIADWRVTVRVKEGRTTRWCWNVSFKTIDFIIYKSKDLTFRCNMNSKTKIYWKKKIRSKWQLHVRL